MSLVIGVTWVPRESETLPMTAFTFDANARFIIYPDGHILPWAMSDFEVRELGPQAGCFRHWLRVLIDLVNNTDADFVGIIPDDVSFSGPIAQAVTERLSDPKDGYCAMYTPTGMGQRSVRLRLTKGWSQILGGWATSWGGCYVFRRDVAVDLITRPFIIRHAATYKRNQQIDHAIPEAIHKMHLRQWMHNPSLCSHVGLISTIGHNHTSEENALGW